MKQHVMSFLQSTRSGWENLEGREDLVVQYDAYKHSFPNENLRKGLEIAASFVEKSDYSSQSRIDIEAALASARDRFFG